MSLKLKAEHHPSHCGPEWSAMQDRMETMGVDGVCSFIDGHEDTAVVAELYQAAQQDFLAHQWAGKSLDLWAELVQSGISWHLEQGRLASQNGRFVTSQRCLQGAFEMSRRAAFALSDFWSGDGMVRERRHMKLGLRTAKDCLRWLREWGASPREVQWLWWIRGLHELSLGLSTEARRSFARAQQEYLAAIREDDEEPLQGTPEGWWFQLNEGFVMLAEYDCGSYFARRKCLDLLEELQEEAGRFANDNEMQVALSALEKAVGRFL